MRDEATARIELSNSLFCLAIANTTLHLSIHLKAVGKIGFSKIIWQLSIVCWLIIGAHFYGSAQQNPAHRNLLQKELDGIEIYFMAQDTNHIYWLATDNGLYRFDGHRLKHVPINSSLSNSLFNIKPDSLGRLYCHNLSGQFFKIENDSCKLVFELPEEKLSSYFDYRINRRNELVIRSKGLETVYIEKLDSNYSYRPKYAWLMDLDDQNTLYNHKKNKILYRINEVTKDTTELYSELELGFEDATKIGNKVYFYDRNTGTLYEFKNDSIKIIEPKVNNLKTYGRMGLFAINNELWFLPNSGGIRRYNPQTNQLKPLIFEETFKSCIMVDNENNVLLGTFGKGLIYIHHSQLKTCEPAGENELIESISSDKKGACFFGTQSGKVFWANVDSLVQLPVKSNDRVDVIEYLPQAHSVLFNGQYFAINKTAKNTKSDFIDPIKDAQRLSNGDVLVATNRGLCVFNNLNLIYQKDYFEKLPELNSRIRSVYYHESENTIYASTSQGLKVLTSTQTTVPKYLGSPIVCNDIKEKNDTIYLATSNFGILLMVNKQVVANWNSNNGLISNHITRIEFYKNQAFISSSEGLQVFDTHKQETNRITLSEGLLSNFIIDFELSKDVIWILNKKGLQYIQLSELPTFGYIPTLKLESVRVNQKAISLAALAKLNQQQSNIEFDFRIPSLIYQNETKLQYQLSNVHKQWQTSLKGNNQLSFEALSPGDYILKVKAVCRNNESEILEFPISIAAPFWQTWWFMALVILGISTVAYLIFSVQLKRHRKRLRIKSELNASKLIAIQSQMNPHFIFNAINSIQDLILKGDVDNSYTYVIKFSKLVRQTLNFSDKEFIDIDEEIDLLHTYLELEALRFDDSFSYQINAENCKDVSVPPMLVQPFIENAIKHGLLHKEGKKELFIQFEKLRHKLTCTIADNGIGRKKAAEIKARQKLGHRSFSVGATQNRIEIMQNQYNQTIGIKYTDLADGETATGTQVVISMPFREF